MSRLPVLELTYGIILYQEQVMQIARAGRLYHGRRGHAAPCDG